MCVFFYFNHIDRLFSKNIVAIYIAKNNDGVLFVNMASLEAIYSLKLLRNQMVNYNLDIYMYICMFF